LRDEVDTWGRLEARARELLELAQLGQQEGDAALEPELLGDLETLEREVRSHEVELLFAGPYDRHPALLSVHAGAGGTDSQDWTEMLLRMYVRWSELHRMRAEVLDVSPGEEAGLKSVTARITGPHAFGRLAAERGVHRLVRLSPFDQAHRRHTSFALVEVIPEIAEDVPLEVRPDELRVDTYRSSGAGGQHVNKTDSAVRITHLPTGIVVSVQNERSQQKNRETAMKILRSRLLARQEEERAQQRQELKGEHQAAEWGNQIRSYVLHPYTLVKDHRTGVEVGNTQSVLDGALDPFIEAYLRSRAGGVLAGPETPEP
jgi:peptide chain release factor 2